MRILSITPTFAPSIGGIEKVVQELALQLQTHRGVYVDIAHVAVENAILSEDCVEGLHVYRVPLRGHRLVGLAPALRDIAGGYDLLHVHDPQLMAISASVQLYCPQKIAVLSTHGGFHHTKRLGFMKAAHERVLTKRMLSHYRRVMASSVGDQEYFQRYSSRVVLCGNGINANKFSSVQAQESRNLHRWIYWGRLSRNKRVDRIIHAAAQARALGHDVDLLICGRDFDGILGELTALVSGLDLHQSIRFESFLSDQDLLKELATRGVYITASEHEGFGLSIVEAMAAGLAIICRDMTPLNSFVTAGQTGGFLRFDGGLEDAELLQTFLSASKDATALMSQRARATALSYSWDEVATRFLNCFTEALAE